MSDAPTFKTDFNGTGSMKEFVDAMVLLLEAMNNIKVEMPPYYAGAPVTVKFEGSSLVFDFGDALIFSLQNVEWIFPSATAVIVENTAEVIGGQEVLTVNAEPDLENVTWHLSGTDVSFDSYSVDLDNDTINIRVTASSTA